MASRPPNAPSQAHLDAVARQRGFPSYAAWAAWNANRSAGLHGQGTSDQSGAQLPAEQNVFQRVLGPIYPPTMFKWIGDRYAAATGQGQ